MKRYMLFLGKSFYAAGGIGDFLGSFDTFQSAAALAKNRVDADRYLDDYWWHVFDTETMKVVAREDGELCGKVPSHLIGGDGLGQTPEGAKK